MKIAFNPSTVAALIAPPNNKDITFDLRGQNIFARGVKFCGTDTNTWRDIKINNVSIDSNTLDLRDGDNTTLTNINGVVTINSTWRPVVDNLTSDSTTSSLSANLGRVLKALIDGKSDSDHNHDDRYLRLTGGLMLGDITFGDDNKIIWGRNTDSASISFKNDGDGDADSYMSFVTSDNGNEYFRWSHSSGSTNTEWMSLRSDGLRVGGTKVSLEGHTHDDRYVKRSGDTMLGALNFANGTWNLVGDDSYMGDCNISGHFGIKAANTTYPGIAFFNNANDNLGNLTAYNGNVKYGAYSLQFLDNGNTSVSASTWTNPFNDYNSNAVADGQAICVWGQSSSLSNLAADSGDMSLWLKRVNANVATLNMVLDGEYYANGNLRLAHVSEIPNSLKNPYALTISLNGTSQGPYDGSAAKNINITPSSIGAATSDHNHDGRYVYNYGGAQMDGASINKNALGMTTNSGITEDWWHILQAAWNSEYRWNSLIAFPTLNRNGMYYRSGLDDNTAWGSWIKLLDIGNSYVTGGKGVINGTTITQVDNATNANNASVASKVYGQVGDTGSHELVRCDMNNDQFRIIAGSNGNNNGWAEIATADDGNEPIYVRQYTGVFSTVKRTLTLLDGSGNTIFPGSLSIGGNIIFPNSSHLLWNSGSWYLRILLNDDSTADTSVFTFLQSSDSGTNWSNLMTIRDNGKIIANTFVGDLLGNASTATALTTNAGNSINPVYFSGGKPIACTMSTGRGNGILRSFSRGTYTSANLYFGNGTIVTIDPKGTGCISANDTILSLGDTSVRNTQLLVAWDRDGVYYRRITDSLNYGNWKRLAFTTDNIASATKLQTPRTIWGQSFDGTADVNGTIYINNSDSSNGAIRLNNDRNSNARISAISDQVIFNTSNAIRFGETSWDWNQWAGLKYNHSNKTIYLGIADNSIFNSNSALSGGTLNLRAGISSIDLNSGTSIRGLPTDGSPYSSRVTLNDTSIYLSAYGDISMSTGPGVIKLASGYGGIELSCLGTKASIGSDFKVEASRGAYLNSRNSGNVYLCLGGGKVGIGTTSPLTALDIRSNEIAPLSVNGAIKLATNPNGAYYYQPICVAIGGIGPTPSGYEVYCNTNITHDIGDHSITIIFNDIPAFQNEIRNYILSITNLSNGADILFHLESHLNKLLLMIYDLITYSLNIRFIIYKCKEDLKKYPLR